MVVPVVIGSTMLIFTMVWVLPGDPIRALSGFKPQPPSVNLALRERYHLNEPLPVQYLVYLGNALTGDFGTNFAGRDVADLIRERLPRTARLASIAVLTEVVVGGIAGVVAAVRHRRFADTLVLVSTLVVLSMPLVVLAPLARHYLGVELGWFPRRGIDDAWWAYLLPGMLLGALSLAYFARLLRASLVDDLRADYVRMATAKGLSRGRVVGVHALRNSLLPALTFLAVDIGTLLSGAVVVETVFDIPGLGLLFIDAVRAQETPVVVGVTTFLVIVHTTLNLLVDLLYAVVDPRIRLE